MSYNQKKKHKLREKDDDDESMKPTKEMKLVAKMNTTIYDKRLIVILVNASLETVKTTKSYELLNCDKHASILKKHNRDIGSCRPDITHQCLLMLMDSPLNRAGLLQKPLNPDDPSGEAGCWVLRFLDILTLVYIQTAHNVLIEINPQTRIPRTFNRFCGLMVQLLHKLFVRGNDTSVKLLKVIKTPVTNHLPAGCQRIGTSFSTDEVVDVRTMVPPDKPIAFVIGAMAHGCINEEYIEKTISISNYPLSAALTCTKICSAFEEKWGIA